MSGSNSTTQLPLRTIIGITQYDRIISIGGSGGIDGGYYAPSEVSLDFLQTPVGVHWGTTGPSGPPAPKPVKPCKSGNWSWKPVLTGGIAQYNLICPQNMVILYWCPPGGNTPDYMQNTYPSPYLTYIAAHCNWHKIDNTTPGQEVPYCAFDNQCLASGLFCDDINNPGGMYTLGVGWQQVGDDGMVLGGYGTGHSASADCFYPKGPTSTSPPNNSGTATTPPNITQPNSGYNIPGQMFAPWPTGGGH